MGGPILETVKPNTLQWLSAAEVLYNAGYTVKTYTSSGSYNYFSWWKNLTAKGLVDDELYNRLMTNGSLFGNGTPGGVGNPLSPTLAATAYLGFEEDCANGTLADVTWLFPDGPYASDEHPPNTPAAGAYFLASKLEALASNEELWNSTVFIINYDENDGFFDHVPPPVPDPDLHPDEYVKVPSPRGTPGGGLPVGAGFRVPCIIVSPWTVGGHIYSQVSDHTSPLRLIEAVTAAGGLDKGTPTSGLSSKQPVSFEAISAWRRETFDDFVGAFHDEALAAPTDEEFDADVREANYEAQLAASHLALPTLPGAAQPTPHQDPVSGAPGDAPGAGTTAGTPPASTADEPYQASTVVSKVQITGAVPVGRRAVVTIRGGKSGSAVVVRNASGKVVARGRVHASGRLEVPLPTDRMARGKHGFTVMFVDASGLHHTKNLKVQVTARHR
jgi:phospholipase C